MEPVIILMLNKSFLKTYNFTIFTTLFFALVVIFVDFCRYINYVVRDFKSTLLFHIVFWSIMASYIILYDKFYIYCRTSI